jgi:CheY-like chemotaxis protein
MKRILVIEDEPQMLLGLRDNLELEGYEVITAVDGEQGLAKAFATKPDLVILDLMLPRKGGFDVCRELRGRGNATPVVMLTARSQDADKVLGLELGADDYLTKPFSIAELLARVRAVLRRATTTAPQLESVQIGGLEVNFRTQGRSGHPRPDPQRGVGLRRGALHPDDRQFRGQATPEDRGCPPSAGPYPDRARAGLQVRGLTSGCRSELKAPKQ